MKTKSKQQGLEVRGPSLSEPQCIWMKAGMVNFKTCENAFDCTSCSFDKEISRKSAEPTNALANWQEVMRQPHLHKECRHMLTGQVLFKLCSHNYECKDCAYDQLLYEYGQILREKDTTVHAAVTNNSIAGPQIREHLLYCGA